MLTFIIYLIIAIITFAILFIKFRKDPYADEDSLTADILIAVAWPIMFILIIGFVFGSILIVLVDSINNDLKK